MTNQQVIDFLEQIMDDLKCSNLTWKRKQMKQKIEELRKNMRKDKSTDES